MKKVLIAMVITLMSILIYAIPVYADDSFDSYLHNIDFRMGHGTKDQGTSAWTSENITLRKAPPDSDITSETVGSTYMPSPYFNPDGSPTDSILNK